MITGKSAISLMLTVFNSVWDGHHGQVNIAKYRIKLSSEETQTIHFAPYRAGPKCREFEKAVIDEMSSEKLW